MNNLKDTNKSNTAASRIPKSIYNVEIERKLITEYNLDLVAKEIDKFSQRASSVRVKALVDTIRLGTENALFGCTADVGLYNDSNAKVIDFYGDRSYVRKVYRGESGAFNAIDHEEIVVEMDANQNIVVFVPFIGPTTSHGVLEVHGLIPENITGDVEYFKRQVDVMRTMLNNKDYSFKEMTRFWKNIPVERYAGIPQKSSFIPMSGRIKDVVFTKNGVPFYGGPRFTIKWENGTKDVELSGGELLRIYKETSKSLGNNTVLDNRVMDKLKEFGIQVGTFLENRKAQIFLKELRMKIKNQQVNIVGMVEMSLQSIPLILRGINEISLIGYRGENDEFKTLVNYAITEKKSKSPVQQNDGDNHGLYQSTALDIAHLMVARTVNSVFTLLDLHSTAWIGMELVVPADFLWNKSIEYNRYLVIIHKKKIHNEEVTPFDVEIIKGVVLEIEYTVKTIWKVEQRRRQFREFIRSLEAKLFEWRNSSTNEMCYNVLTSIPKDLFKAHMYVALLQPGADELVYISANTGSRMEGRRLKRGNGVSFDVIDSGNTLIFDASDLDKKKLLMPDATVDVYYGKKLYKATIVKNRGHEMYDVRYACDRKVEAGVDMARIIPMNIAFRTKLFQNAKLPFTCVAVRHRNKTLGIMGIDNVDSECFINGSSVDGDMQMFLEQLGKLLGNAIDIRQKKQAIQALYVVSKNTHSDIPDVINAFFDTIFRCSAFIEGVIVSEFKASDKPHMIRSRYPQSAKVIDAAAISNEKVLVVIGKRGSVSHEIEKKMKNFDYSKFGKRPVQRIGNKGVWLFVTATTDQESRLYAVILSYKTPIADADYEFFETLQKTLTAVIQTILSQKASGEFRYEAMREMKELCHEHYLLNKRRHYNIFKFYRREFFNRLEDITLSCYHSSNMYVGILGKFASEILYTLATSHSQMVGKKLLRSDNKGVSFGAIDEDRPLCVTASSLLSHKLKHFAEKHNFEYPFLVIPLLAGVDSVIGILAADNCAGDQIAESAEQLEDVISFFTTITIFIGNIIQQYRVADVNEHLVNLASTVTSFAEGVQKLKTLLLSYLPFASRIVEITFRPHIDYAMNYDCRGESIPAVLDKDLVLLLCVKEVKLFLVEDGSINGAQEKPKLKILVNGHVHQEILINPTLPSAKPVITDSSGKSSKSGKREKEKGKGIVPIKVVIPKGTTMEKIKIQFTVTVQREGFDKDIVSKLLPFHYFLNVPVTLQEHYFDSSSNHTSNNLALNNITENGNIISTNVHLNQIRMGSMKLCSRILANNQLVGFHISNLKAMIQTGASPDEAAISESMEMYISIKWNGDYVGRTVGSSLSTTASQNNKTLEYEGLNSFLPSNSYKNFEENRLHLEFFCNYDPNNPTVTVANKSREYFMCSIEITGDQLIRMFIAQHQHHRQQQQGHAGRTELPFVTLELHGNGSECPVWITSLKCYLHGLLLPIQHSIVDPYCYLKILKLHDEALELQSLKPSKLIRMEKQRSTNRLVEEFVPCELRILKARDLFIPDYLRDKLSRSALASLDSVITMTFNGEEVGSTSIAHNTTSPEWSDESFRVMLPLSNPNSWKDELEGAVLLIEVFLVDDAAGMQYKLGSLSIEGGDLGMVFLAKTQRMVWYDIDTDDNSFNHIVAGSATPVATTSARKNLTAPFMIENRSKKIISTQILLSGKMITTKNGQLNQPGSANSAERQHIVDAVDNGFLQATVCSLSDPLALTRSICHEYSGTVLVTITFNGKIILETEEKELTQPIRKISWSTNNTVAFRHPSPKTLFQSSLTFTVWHNLLGIKSKISEFSYSGGDLAKLLGKQGIVTRWCALPLLNALHENNLCDLEIQAGPYNSRPIYEYDDFSVWLDLACCSQLSLFFKPPPRNDFRNDQRPNVFCLVYWNNEVVGRTEIEEHASSIVYERQRFILRVPLYCDESKRLIRCNLRIEVHHQPYDVEERIVTNTDELGATLISSKSTVNMKNAKFQYATEPSQLLGLIEISGDELESFFRSDLRPEMHWFTLKQASDIEESKNKAKKGAVSIIKNENKSFLKLRGSHSLSVNNMLVMNEDTMSELQKHEEIDSYRDYVLHILKAVNLANTDAYGGANAYVEVIWQDETIGFTQVIPDTLNEIFQHEQFILRWDKGNKYETPNLLLQIWSISPGKPKTFLGHVVIAGKDILQLLSLADNQGSTDERIYKLEMDPEMTEEENEMVGGNLTIEIEKIDYKEVIQGPKMLEESIFWIQSAANLPSLDSFNTSPSTFFTVVRCYEREGGEEVEIHRSTPCNDTFNPVYLREFVKILVPNQSDWSGFKVMINFHNALDQDIIASLELKEERLKRILTRDSPLTVVELREYRLQVQEWVIPLSRAASTESPRVSIGGGYHAVFQTVERNIVLEQTKLVTGNMKKQFDEPAVSKDTLDVSSGDSDSDTGESKDNVASIEVPESMRRESMNNNFSENGSKKENEKMQFELILESLSMDSTVPGQQFDGYLELRWKHNQDVILKSSTMKLGFNGTKADFDCERFILEKGEGIHITSCSLEVIIYQKFQLKESLPLAEVMLLGDDLISLLRRGPQKGKHVNWKFSVAKSATPSGKAEAHINVTLRVIPDIDKSLLFNRKLPPPSGNPFTELELTVVAASGLAKAKMLGSSDPYATITYNFANLGQTVAITDTLDPVWIDNQSFTFRFPRKYDPMLRMLTSAIDGSKSRGGSKIGSRQGRRRNSTFKLQDDSDEAILAKDGIYSAEHLTIYIDFYSYGSMKPHTFLGCVELSGDMIQEMLSENYNYTKDKRWLPLVATNRKKLADQKYVQGQVQLLLTKLYVTPPNVGIITTGSGSGSNSRMSLNRGGQNSNHNSNHNSNRNTMILPEDAKEIDILVLGARDILLEPKAADSYVVIRWNGKIIGKTYIEKESTSPTWENEKFTIRIPPNIVMADCVLHLELWQAKSSQGQNNQDLLLGSCDMDGDMLEELMEGSSSPFTNNNDAKPGLRGGKQPAVPGIRWIKLGKSEYIPEKVHHFTALKMAQLPTSLQIRCHYADQEKLIGGHVRRYEIKVFGAEGIANLETSFSSMDVFVIAKWDGREIGRSYKVTNSTSPIWKNQVFPLIFPVHHHNFHESKLTFEIWNQNRFTRNDFLGMVSITGEDLVNIFEHHKVKKGIRRKYFLIGNHHNLKTNKEIDVKGLLDLGVKLLSEDKSLIQVDSGDDSEGSDEEEMNISILQEEMKVTWFENIDQSSGKPFIEFTVLSVQVIPTQVVAIGSNVKGGTSASNSKLGFSSGILGNNSSSSWLSRIPKIQKNTSSAEVKQINWKPSCTVSWNDEEVNHLPPIELNHSDWSASWEIELHRENSDGSAMIQRNTTFISLPNTLHDLEVSKLSLEVWDNDDFESNAGYLGGLMLPFPELLRLYCGRFSFFLLNNIDDSNDHQSTGQPAHNHRINSDVWMGNITFAIKFIFPFWDSSVSLLPSKYTRRIHVLGAANLPLINGELPTTKCVLSINGVVVVKSIVITGQTHPTYPRITKDLLLDVNQPPNITVEIFHVNVKNRKEIKLGEESIPVEYLLRPPKQSIDLFIGPPKDESQRPKSSEYSFALSGSIRVLVEGNNRLDNDYMPFLSPQHQVYDMARLDDFGNQYEDSMAKFSRSSTSFAWSHVSSELVHMHETTTIADWLTNPVSLGTAQEVASQPNWLLLPIFDIGVSVGVSFSPFGQSTDDFSLNSGTSMGGKYLKLRRTSVDHKTAGLKPSAIVNNAHAGSAINGGEMTTMIGTKPGCRLVYAIERPLTNMAVSDKALLQSILESISSVFAKLRWKDVNSKLREIAYNCLTVFVKESVHHLKSAMQNKISFTESIQDDEKGQISHKDKVHHFLHFVRRCLELCFPGATIRFVHISEDFETLYYECSEGHAHSNHHGLKDVEGGVKGGLQKKVVPARLGDDQQYFGKQNHKSIAIHNYQDLNHSLSSAIDSNGLLLFKPFLKSYAQLPRFNAMFMSEDCSFGFFQIENFHFFQGGLPPVFDDPSLAIASGALAPVDFDGIGGEDMFSTSDYSQSTTNSLGPLEPVFTANSQEFKNIRKWLESVGELCGFYIYSQLEARVMAALQEYLSHHTSHYQGLLAVVLEQIVQAVQGCKLTEIITVEPTSTSNEFKLTSALYRQPASSLPTTNLLYTFRIMIENLQISIKRNPAEYETIGKSSSVPSGGGLLDKVGGKQAWHGMKKIFTGNNNTDTDKQVTKSIRFEEFPSNDVSKRDDHNHEEQEDVMFMGADSLDEDEGRYELQSKSISSSVISRYIALHRMVLGIRYDEFEQIVPLKYNQGTDTLTVDKSQPINIFLKPNFASLASTSNGLISMSIYEVDNYLHPVHENFGQLHNISSMVSAYGSHMYTEGGQDAPNTVSAKTILSPITMRNGIYYEAMYKLTLMSTEDQHLSAATLSTKKAAQANAKNNLPPIKGFKLHLVKAKNLKTLKSNSPPSVFCEIIYQKKVIFTTKTIKNTTTPDFDDHIYIPYAAAAAAAKAMASGAPGTGKDKAVSSKGKSAKKTADNSVILELYDMTFLAKGNFFGRVEVTFEQLLATLGQEAVVKEYPLKMKADMNPQKQTHVGGTLFFSIVADLTGNTESDRKSDGTGENGNAKNNHDIIEHWHRVKQMMNPRIKLTIESANDLMAANRFGGGSDPFVIIYFTYPKKKEVNSINNNAGAIFVSSIIPATKISPKLGSAGASEDIEEPQGKTTVKLDTVHPIWNELFDLGLLDSNNTSGNMLLGAKRDKLLFIDEMPMMRFELYDYNQFTSATFLGQCEVSPEVYLNRNNVSVELADRTNASTGNTSNKPSTNKASLLSHLAQQKIKGSLNLRWEFYDRGNDSSSSLSGALSREQRLLQWVWNPSGGLTRLDCIELKIIQVTDINRGKKTLLTSSCNPYCLVKTIARAKPAHHHHHHHHHGGHSEEKKDGENSISIHNNHSHDVSGEQSQASSSGGGLAPDAVHHHTFSPASSNAAADAAEYTIQSSQQGDVSMNNLINAAIDESSIVGKTKRKKNTLSPVYNETFNLNLSLKYPDEYPNLLIEVWHKDDYFGTEEFLGEVLIPAEDYLHPQTSDSSSSITLNLMPNKLKNNAKDMDFDIAAGQIVLLCTHSQIIQSVPLTKHNHELFHRYNHSTGVEFMEMEMIDSSKEELEELRKKNPIYGQRMPLSMTYDPTLELHRQKQEHTEMPFLINQTNQQLDKYLKNPFVRTGLISELHYGQLCAASKRCEKTVLRTEQTDMLCIPMYVRKPPATTAVSNTTTEAGADTTPTNVSAAITANNANIKHQAAYLVCRFPANRSSRRDMKFLEKLQGKVLSCYDTLAAREQRKAALTQLLQNITVTASMLGLSSNENGDGHKKATSSNTTTGAGGGAGSPTSAIDVMIQAMLDFEVSVNCSARCYLLHEDGTTFHPVSLETGKIQPTPLTTQNAIQQHEFIQELASILRYDVMIQYYQQRISICKCSWNSLKFSQVDLPEVIELYDEIECFLGVKELKKCKKVMKQLREMYLHEGCFVIPIFSFQEVMIGMLILKNINQNPFALYEYYEDEDIKVPLPVVGASNGPGLTHVGTSSFGASLMSGKRTGSMTRGGGDLAMSPNGLQNETSSRAVDKEFDYNDEPDEDELKQGKRKRKIKTIQGMEHGISQILLKSSMMFSDVYLTARLNNAYRSIRSFPLKADTSPLMVIRYAFRMLITAIPVIRDISIWAIHLPNAKQLLTANHAQEMFEAMQKKPSEKEEEHDEDKDNGDNEYGSSKKAPPGFSAMQKQGSMFQRMLSFSSKSAGGGGGSAVSGMANFLRQSFRGTPSGSAKNSGSTLVDPSTKTPTTAAKKGVMVKSSDLPKDYRILSGVFGEEDPNVLMNAPMERKTPGSLSGATPIGGFGARKVNNAFSKREEEQKLQEQKAEEAAAWKVHLPRSLDVRKRKVNFSEESKTVQSYSLDLAYNEIVRCVEILQQKTFALHTGHCLSQIGGNDMDTTTKDLIMSTLFNQVFIFANKQRASIAVANSSSGSNKLSSSVPLGSGSGSNRPNKAPIPQGPPPESSKTSSTHQNPNSMVRRNNIAAVPMPSGGSPSELIKSTATTPTGPTLAAPAKPFVRRHGTLLPRPTNAGTVPSPLVPNAQTPPAGRNRRSAMVTETKNLEQKKVHFFLSVNTHGIGGVDGWGHIGPQVQKAVEHVTFLLDTNLTKLGKIRADAMAKKLAAEEEENAREENNIQGSLMEAESSLEGSSSSDSDEHEEGDDSSSSKTDES